MDLKKQGLKQDKSVEEDVEEEIDTTELPPNMPMSKENKFQGLLTNLSMKIDTFDKQIETTMKEELEKTVGRLSS